MYINSVCNATNYYYFFLFTFTQHISALYGHLQVSDTVETHIDAVWQFRHIQTPEDGHIGPKHVALSESEKKNNLLHYRRN
jgi:hypothetical protein